MVKKYAELPEGGMEEVVECIGDWDGDWVKVEDYDKELQRADIAVDIANTERKLREKAEADKASALDRADAAMKLKVEAEAQNLRLMREYREVRGKLEAEVEELKTAAKAYFMDCYGDPDDFPAWVKEMVL